MTIQRWSLALPSFQSTTHSSQTLYVAFFNNPKIRAKRLHENVRQQGEKIDQCLGDLRSNEDLSKVGGGVFLELREDFASIDEEKQFLLKKLKTRGASIYDSQPRTLNLSRKFIHKENLSRILKILREEIENTVAEEKQDYFLEAQPQNLDIELVRCYFEEIVKMLSDSSQKLIESSDGSVHEEALLFGTLVKHFQRIIKFYMKLSGNLKKYSESLESEKGEIKKNIKAFLSGIQLQQAYFAKEHKYPDESMESDFKELHISKQPLLKTASSSLHKEIKDLAKQFLESEETLFLVLSEKNNALQILISEIADLKQVIEKREAMYQDMIKKYEETRYELSKMVRSAKYAGNNEDELLNKIDELKISELETKLEVMQAQKNDLLGVIEKKKKKLKYMSQASASIELPRKKSQEIQFPDDEFLKEKAKEEAKNKEVEESILRLRSLNKPLVQVLESFESASFGVAQSREWSSHLINQILIDKVHDDVAQLQEKRTPLCMKKYVCQWFMSTFGTRSMAEIFLKDFVRSLQKDESNLQRFKLFLGLLEIKMPEEPSMFKIAVESQELMKLNELWGTLIRPKSKTQKLTESLIGTSFTASVIVKGAMLIESSLDKKFHGLLPVIPALDCDSSQKFYASKISFSKARDILDQILFSYEAAEQLFTDDRLMSSDLLEPFISDPESEKPKVDVDLFL